MLLGVFKALLLDTYGVYYLLVDYLDDAWTVRGELTMAMIKSKP